ncbi:MAG TPA: PAS domain-containing protein [Thermoanaerobaculia bacterium]|nr:PAS domain-containing protein [Thermoanaerobaculia bacterium]
MKDMIPAQIAGEGREVRLRYFNGGERTVIASDLEVPYPEGRLIVSRTDPEGVITHVNDSFCEISGYHRDELIGQPHCILRHPDMPAAAFKDLWTTVLAGGRWHGYVKNLCKDGRFYWVYATVIPNLRNGKVVGFTSVRREASRTKIREAEELYRTMG